MRDRNVSWLALQTPIKANNPRADSSSRHSYVTLSLSLSFSPIFRLYLRYMFIQLRECTCHEECKDTRRGRKCERIQTRVDFIAGFIAGIIFIFRFSIKQTKNKRVTIKLLSVLKGILIFLLSDRKNFPKDTRPIFRVHFIRFLFTIESINFVYPDLSVYRYFKTLAPETQILYIPDLFFRR